jgi:PAS domain S-box-containing protein
VVADDEEGLLFLMVDALRREGFEVEGFESGEDALEWLTRESADLLLLDLKLGDLPAPQLIERLRERGRDFPFVVITGHGDERTAVEVMKQGALDYVMKESGVLDLLPAIVRRALGAVERERKLVDATATVRRGEERHRKIVQTALDGFISFDGEGRVLEVNGALCALLGQSEKDLLRSKLFDIEATIGPVEIRQHLAQLREQGFARWFTRVKGQEGRMIEVEISMRADGNEFFGFIHDVSEQRRLEREVLEIGEEERRRFGCELHDNLGQQLTALELMSAALTRDLKRIAPALAKPASSIAENARKMIAQIRQLAHGLAPVALGTEGLRAALADLAQVTAATGIDCALQCSRPVQIAGMEAATHLYRIAQEAVSNALKHARATRIILALSERGGAIELAIEDNGRGLAASHAKKSGMGLRVIHHRARLIGATLQVHSIPKEGVRVVCTLPKKL